MVDDDDDETGRFPTSSSPGQAVPACSRTNSNFARSAYLAHPEEDGAMFLWVEENNVVFDVDDNSSSIIVLLHHLC